MQTSIDDVHWQNEVNDNLITARRGVVGISSHSNSGGSSGRQRQTFLGRGRGDRAHITAVPGRVGVRDHGGAGVAVNAGVGVAAARTRCPRNGNRTRRRRGKRAQKTRQSNSGSQPLGGGGDQGQAAGGDDEGAGLGDEDGEDEVEGDNQVDELGEEREDGAQSDVGRSASRGESQRKGWKARRVWRADGVPPAMTSSSALLISKLCGIVSIPNQESLRQLGNSIQDGQLQATAFPYQDISTLAVISRIKSLSIARQQTNLFLMVNLVQLVLNVDE